MTDVTELSVAELSQLNVQRHQKTLSSMNSMECTKCQRNFYNTEFRKGKDICKKCRCSMTYGKYSSDNDMQPSPLPIELTGLTMYEKMHISAAHTNILMIRLKLMESSQ